jgi:hypothetical protein
MPTERPPLVGEVSANFCGHNIFRIQVFYIFKNAMCSSVTRGQQFPLQLAQNIRTVRSVADSLEWIFVCFDASVSTVYSCLIDTFLTRELKEGEWPTTRLDGIIPGAQMIEGSVSPRVDLDTVETGTIFLSLSGTERQISVQARNPVTTGNEAYFLWSYIFVRTF